MELSPFPSEFEVPEAEADGGGGPARQTDNTYSQAFFNISSKNTQAKSLKNYANSSVEKSQRVNKNSIFMGR